MNRVEVYENKSGTLVGDLFVNQSPEPLKKLSHKEVLKMIKILETMSVEQRQLKNDILSAKFKENNMQININEYSQLTKYEEIAKLAASISKNTIQKPKKVQRKNKHGKKIVALAMTGAVILLGQSITKQIKNVEKTEKLIPEKEIEEIVEDVNIETQGAFEDIKVESTIVEKETKKEEYETRKEEKTETTKQQEPESTKEVKYTYTPQKMNNYYQDNNSNYDYKISINFQDERDNEKYQFVEDNYSYLIEKYADIYGVDAKLVKAIATQERGHHSSVIDPGGGIGLMQVQYNVWVGHELTSYNFELGDYETLVVDGEKLQDLEYVIKIGTKILRHYLERADYNVAAATFGYNKGITGVVATANNYLSDPEDLSWVEDARNLPNGDDFYLENVFRYIGEEELNIRKNDGSFIRYYVQSSAKTRTH